MCETFIEKTITWFSELAREDNEEAEKARGLFLKRLFKQLPRNDCFKIGQMAIEIAKKKVDKDKKIRQDNDGTEVVEVIDDEVQIIKVVDKIEKVFKTTSLCEPSTSKTPYFFITSKRKEKEKIKKQKIATNTIIPKPLQDLPYIPLLKSWCHGKEILCEDCTMVRDKAGNQLLASVTLVDENGKMVLHERVRRKKGSFVIDGATRSLNGFQEDTLDNEEYLEEKIVQKKVQDLVADKILVGCGMINDIAVLDLDVFSDTIIFDLQWFFFYQNGVDFDVENKPHSLKNLTAFFFPNQIVQSFGMPHRDDEEAKVIAKIFIEYLKIKLAKPEFDESYMEHSIGDLGGVDLKMNPNRKYGWYEIQLQKVEKWDKRIRWLIERESYDRPIYPP